MSLVVRPTPYRNMISFSPIYSTLSKITGIAKGLLDTHVQVQINDVAIELQGAILELQSKVSAIQAEYQEALKAKEDTEKKLISYEQWQQESSRYSLGMLAPGIFAYRLKIPEPLGQPLHWLCAACYQERKKSILQTESKGSDVLICPNGHPPLVTDERG